MTMSLSIARPIRAAPGTGDAASGPGDLIVEVGACNMPPAPIRAFGTTIGAGGGAPAQEGCPREAGAGGGGRRCGPGTGRDAGPRRVPGGRPPGGTIVGIDSVIGGGAAEVSLGAPHLHTY